MVIYNPDCWIMCSLNSELLGNLKYLWFETSYENKQDIEQHDRQCTYNGTSMRVRVTVVSVEKR